MFDKRIIWYAEQIYDTKISITYSKDKTVMFIKTPENYFKIYLLDFERFGYYSVMHENHYGEKGWHRQLRARSLNYAIYMCCVHDFNKENSIWSYNFDYKRFMDDAYKAYNWKEKK